MADISKISPDAGTTEYNVKDATARSDIASIVEKIPVNASSSNKFATEADIASAYHAAGTKTVAELLSSLLVAANEGNVYNMTDAGTTTADFIEGAGKPIRIGDNVGVCKVGNDYKFDLLSGFIDTSNFVEKSSTSGLLKNDGTVDTTSYVEAETGKGLSTNDYDATAKGIVDSIPLTVSQLQGSLLEKFPRSEAEILGAKNLLPNTAKSGSDKGITYTVNADKSVSIGAGTVTGGNLTITLTTNAEIPANKRVFLSGCPQGGSADSYMLAYQNASDQWKSAQYDIGNGMWVTDGIKRVAISILNNVTVSAMTFYPMISLNGGAYQAPAMTNRQLTEKREYNIGDSIRIQNSIWAGHLTNGSTEINCFIPLNKPINKNVTGIAFSNSMVNIRANGDYLINNGNLSDYVISNVTVNDLGIFFWIKKSDSSAFATFNNVPASIQVYSDGKLTLS